MGTTDIHRSLERILVVVVKHLNETINQFKKKKNDFVHASVT